MKTWAILVAGGSGSRFGGPKQFSQLSDESVLARSVRIAAGCVDGVVVVAAAAHLDEAAEVVGAVAPGAAVVIGGTTRAESVRNGLAALPADVDLVLVHDAARPLATPAIYRAVITALLAGADAVVPAISVVDTIRSLDGHPVDRDRLVAVQTPQGFRAAALRAAHEGAPEATDDAALVEAVGGSVVLVPGERANLKVTTPIDLVLARALIAAEESP